GEVITSIRQDDDNPGVRASEALMALLYPDGHPYGCKAKGTIDAVEQFTRERLLQLHRDRFAPGELTAVIVGDVDPTQAGDAVERVLGGWSAPAPPALSVPR